MDLVIKNASNLLVILLVIKVIYIRYLECFRVFFDNSVIKNESKVLIKDYFTKTVKNRVLLLKMSVNLLQKAILQKVFSFNDKNKCLENHAVTNCCQGGCCGY